VRFIRVSDSMYLTLCNLYDLYDNTPVVVDWSGIIFVVHIQIFEKNLKDLLFFCENLEILDFCIITASTVGIHSRKPCNIHIINYHPHETLTITIYPYNSTYTAYQDL